SARPYISQIEQNLEDAYHKYTNELQVKPYTSGLAKLVVEVYEFPGKKNFLMGYTAPEMAIELNANYLDQESVLMATPAHELFHKVQYNYGYRTKWFVNGEHNHNHDEKDVHDEEDDGHDNIFSWFAEGTAAWAEYYIANTVSESLKIKSMYFEPQVPLFKHASESFPFWDFFFNHIERFKDKRQTVHPMNVVLENLLKTEGKVLQTVVNSINQYDKSVNDIDDVFAIFCNYRRFIDETSYTPELKQEVKSLFNNKLKKLRNEQVYTASVKPLACNYYYKSRIKFDNLKNLEFTIESENQDDCLICELALNREKNPKRLKFDPLKKCYTITISEKDNLLNGKNNELILMVNGKMGKANKYTYMLSHSTK
ncbi:MAG: hypothetical protein R2753_18105, partial [Chitinophagales bacterium]